MANDGRDGLKDLLRRYLESNKSIPKLNRHELEHLVRELVASGVNSRERVEDLFEDIRARSRRGLDSAAETIREEMHREFEHLQLRRREELLDFLERGVHLVGDYLGDIRRGTEAEHSKKGPSKKAPTRPVAKKSAANKAPAKKAGSGKKSSGKRSAAKERQDPSSGVETGDVSRDSAGD